MNRRTKYLLVGAVVVAVAAGGTGVAVASGAGGDDDRPITGSALDRATAAALDHTGDGRVTGTEIEDEESYYEVEVTRADGSQVDVQIDRAFNVVSDENDDESGGNDD